MAVCERNLLASPVTHCLESMAVELLAARKPTDTELQPLIEATEAMERALQVDDLDAWARAPTSRTMKIWC